MARNGVDLICNIGELTSLFEGHGSINQFLQSVAETIAKHMQTAVCSIYLFNDDEQLLVLQATCGLDKRAIGQVSLAPGEGLVGLAFRDNRIILEAKGSDNPNFKFIPDIQEETFEAFLAVPILRGDSRIGVITVQDTKDHAFDWDDERVLKAIANQLATIIENARLLISLGRKKEGSRKINSESLDFIKGESASHGVASGKVLIWGNSRGNQFLEEKFNTLKPGLEDFEKALVQTEVQLLELQKAVSEDLSDVASLIFSAHLLILKDVEFSGAMRKRIEGGELAHKAVFHVVDHYIGLFENHANQSLKEKVHDIKDLGQRLLYNLLGEDEARGSCENRIIIADEVLPSDMLKISAQKAAGLIMIDCTVTSHISVLARSLGMPVILLKERELLLLPPESFVIIDANQGNAYINPGEAIITEYEKHRASLVSLEEMRERVKFETRTSDGVEIILQANVNLLSDLTVARSMKARGIGLYRSEFPFIIRNEFPSEEEQTRIYKKLYSSMEDEEVTIRTLDIGGDKMLSFYPHIDESNPFLGMRAIRFSLKNKDIFSHQIKAILRAAEGRVARIMFPLISSVDDFISARDIVDECKESLRKEQCAFCENPLLGAMIELPSAVAVIKELAWECDFFSIGSNDLVQYMLAVDRTNSSISDLYQPHHPAVLRSLKQIVEAGKQEGISVSLCGDIASDEHLLPFLLGIGLRTLSLDALSLPQVQKLIESINLKEAEILAEKALNMARIKEIESLLGVSQSFIVE